MYVFFKCVAEAVAEKGLRGLAEMVPGGGAIFDIAKATWEKYRERCKEDKQREEIEHLAKASFEEAKEAAVAAAQQAAGNNPEVQAVIDGQISPRQLLAAKRRGRSETAAAEPAALQAGRCVAGPAGLGA